MLLFIYYILFIYCYIQFIEFAVIKFFIVSQTHDVLQELIHH